MYYHHAFFHIPPKENMEELEEDLDNPCPAWIAHRATHLFFQLSGRNIYAKVFFLFFLKIIKNKKTSKSLIRYFSFLGIGIPSLVKLRTMSSGRRKGEGKVCFFFNYHTSHLLPVINLGSREPKGGSEIVNGTRMKSLLRSALLTWIESKGSEASLVIRACMSKRSRLHLYSQLRPSASRRHKSVLILEAREEGATQPEKGIQNILEMMHSFYVGLHRYECLYCMPKFFRSSISIFGAPEGSW